MSDLKHWNGTDDEFWDAVGDIRESDRELLAEILRLAGVRAEMVHRHRSMAAAGYRARLSGWQLLNTGLTQEELDQRSEHYAERCRQEIAESRYIPRKDR